MIAVPFTFTEAEITSLALEFLRDPARPPLKSAQAAFGDDSSLVGKCLYAITEVVKEDRFLDTKKLLEEQGAGKTILPTKDEVLKRILSLSEGGFHQDRIKALELYSKVAGYLETGKVTVNANSVFRVMEVPVSSSNDEWEAGLQKQQEALIENATKH